MNNRTRTATQGTLNFISGAVLYLFGIVIYLTNPYYKDYISRQAVNLDFVPENLLQPAFRLLFKVIGNSPYEIIWHLYFAYLIYGLLKLWANRKTNSKASPNRPFLFILGISKLYQHYRPSLSRTNKPDWNHKLELDKEVKNSLLFLVLRFVFFPVTLNFFFGNFEYFFSSVYSISFPTQLLDGQEDIDRTRVAYLAFFYLVSLIDIAYFLIGYLFEFGKKSLVRSVDNSLFGWLVVLACYPPLSEVSSRLLSWGSTDFSRFNGNLSTFIATAVCIILLSIYIWATFSLGLRVSNLTNRGITNWGPYRYVRHPAYASLNLIWLIMALPLLQPRLEYTNWIIGSFKISLPFPTLNWITLAALIAWMGLYFLRAITEERHLLQDPEYQSYCKKVKYRFIPKIY